MMLLSLAFIATCWNPKSISKEIQKMPQLQTLPDVNNYRSISDIPLPPGYSRIKYPTSSFAAWLRMVKLKKDKHVHLFDGSLKKDQSAQFAVLDISVGHQDLQQCADAIIRLRAEYFYSLAQYDNIRFTDNDNKVYQFKKPYNRNTFLEYLNRVFSMCGSASLEKQLLKHVEFKEVIPGDVLIYGGYPGHAEIVMDCAVNEVGSKIYILAQSYMPAQDIHVLVNPTSSLSPWYLVDDHSHIQTPQYTFSRTALKRW